MTKLVWDQIGKRTYETGTDHGVLFVQDETGAHLPGVAWNGLTAVTQSPTGGEETALYADNIKYLSLFSVESFEGTIEAYTYPDEFAECDGSKEAVKGLRLGQQPRKPFSLVYRSYVGNDVIGTAAGYKIHILYNLKASPSERAYETVNETPGAITFSWGVTSTPIAIDDVNYQPTSVVEIDSTAMPKDLLLLLEKYLFGNEDKEATLPLPDELLKIAKDYMTYYDTYNMSNAKFRGFVKDGKTSIEAYTGVDLPEGHEYVVFDAELQNVTTVLTTINNYPFQFNALSAQPNQRHSFVCTNETDPVPNKLVNGTTNNEYQLVIFGPSTTSGSGQEVKAFASIAREFVLDPLS